MLAGDNFGSLTLIDISRKLVQDRFKVPGFEGRRILSLSSCTLEWAGTQLTYVAVCARACPSVKVLAFKHQDCKLRCLYSLNLIPDLANPETPELNADQSYLNFPAEVKLSLDCAFLAVTLASGEV